MSIDAHLKALGIELPPPPSPVATYVPAVQAGDLLFVSGVIPVREGKPVMIGKVGKDLTLEQGYEAARVALCNALAIVQQEVGSLDRVTRVVRMVGYVASGEGFSQQSAVINGASDLLVAIFHDRGRHARLAVGAAELPLGVPVEIELIVQIR